MRQLLVNSDHAEYLQYKLDTGCRPCLLDELGYQPAAIGKFCKRGLMLQKRWAAYRRCLWWAEQNERSIYRFRRANTQFVLAWREQLRKSGGDFVCRKTPRAAMHPRFWRLGVFLPLRATGGGRTQYDGFENHLSPRSGARHFAGSRRCCRCHGSRRFAEVAPTGELRNPLLEAFPAAAAGAREGEAAQLADKILEIVGQ